MPRIRTIKPEHKQHRKVGQLSHFTYRLWVGLLTEADDEGRVVADPLQIRVVVFPYFPRITAAQIQAGLDEIARVGLGVMYIVAGVQYIVLPSYPDHQRISHPSKSKLPSPPIPEHSGGLRSIPEDSGGLHRDRKGSEGIKEGKGSGGEGSVRGGEHSPADSVLSGSSNGHSPARGEYATVLARIRRAHPELAEAEAENQALATIQTGRRT